MRLGSTNNPAKSQQPMAADPTAGFGLGTRMGGYPDHVAIPSLQGCAAGRPDPSHKVHRPVAPLALLKGDRRGHTHVLINVGRHCTVPPPQRVHGGVTCRHHGRGHAHHPRCRIQPDGPNTPNGSPLSRRARADFPTGPAGRDDVAEHAHHLLSDLRDRDRTLADTAPPTPLEVGIHRQARTVEQPSRPAYKAFTLQTPTHRGSDQGRSEIFRGSRLSHHGPPRP